MDILSRFFVKLVPLLLWIWGILFLISFVLGEVGRIDLGNGIAFTALDGFTGGSVVFWGVYMILTQGKLYGRFLWPLILFLLVCGVSLFFNLGWLSGSERVVSFLYLIRFSMYICFYELIFHIPVLFRKKIPLLFLSIGGVILFLGFVQYFLYPDLRNLYYLGWDIHLYRMFSVFLDPNFLGGFLVLYLLVLFGFVFQHSVFRLGNRRVMFFVFPGVMTLAGLALTYSRSAFLMLFSGVSIFFIARGYAKYLVILFLVLFVFGSVIFGMTVKRSEGTNLLRTTSTFARGTTMVEAWNIFVKHPVFGVGFNSYRYALHRSGYSSGEFWAVSHGGGTTDNSFLFVLATTGVTGFVLFLFLWWRVICLFWERRKSIWAAVGLASVVGLFADSFFINALFYPFFLLWLWVLIGFIDCT